MKRFASWFVALALTTLSTLSVAAPPSAPSTRGPACSGEHDGPHQADKAPDGWRKAPSGILLPGVPPTIKEQIETYREMYIPGRAQPGARIIVPGPPKLLVPAKPDASRLVVVKGGSRDAMARALIENGNFKEAREYFGKTEASDSPSRGVSAQMRRQAVALHVPHAERVVSEYVDPGKPKDNKERVVRVMDHFFMTGNMPGEERVLRKEGAPPVKNDKVANAVYENSGTVAEFYKTTLGRNSIDDKGMPIHSIVRQKDMDDNGEIKPMSNAYWRDRDARMRYGEGEEKGYSNFTALDITGHELTHGVTSMTAKLEYRGQSGALNESFSDVLGTAIAQWKAGVTVKQADWRIGGEAMGLRSAPGVKAIRSMSDPNSIRKQPAHMSQFKDMPIDDDHDWGGVHTNSGIPNRAFYGAAMRIGGFVWEKSSKIWYVALRDYLKKDSNFVDAAHATVHVAGELYGDGSREQQAVIAGWKDVGIAVTAGESAAMQPRAKGTEFVVVTPGKANDTKDAPAPKP